MDSTALATDVVAFLVPYLADASHAAATEEGKKLLAALEQKFKGQPIAEAILQGVRAAPMDADAQVALRWQLKNALRTDPAFRDELAALWRSVSIRGNDNVVGNRNTVARDHSVAVGGNVSGGIHINELPPSMLALFARQFGFEPDASDADALRAYFNNVIFERHSKLSFLFIRPETGKVYTEADIETVFVPLQITMPEAGWWRDHGRVERFGRAPEEMKLVTLPELLNKHDCFLLRGKPGSGKTTLLRHIALSFARGEQREKLNWQGDVPLPLLVPLRNFGAFLKKKEYVSPQPRAMFEYLEEHLRGAQVAFSPDFLRRRLENGQCLLLLDALDETAGTLNGGGDLRKEVARQVAAFIERYRPKGNRFVLTSRPRAYRVDSTIRQALPQPEICDVLDLSTEGYSRLMTNLLVVLTGDEAVGKSEAQDLLARIATNKLLSDLAGNPLLCTTLVLVYKYRGRKLPERRVDVLHEIVTLLLGRWEEERRNVTAPGELAQRGTPEHTTERAIHFRRRALSALAWYMQQKAMAELPAAEAIRVLMAFYQDEKRVEDEKTARDWADEFLLVAHERSGLFIALDEGLHTFAHQAFREYLAATYLVDLGEQALLAEVLRHAPQPDEWWEQVILLAGAHPQLSSGAAGRLIETLLEQGDVAYAHLAACCAHDMTDMLPGRELITLQDWLLEAMRDDRSRSPQEREMAGRALALVGDPRFAPHHWYLPDDPLLGFVRIPAGEFWMGTRAQDIPVLLERFGGKREWYEWEAPQHKVTLPEYYIARYPVTVAQWRAFVEDSKYQPEDARSLRDPDNHPVRYVTWYEALAYCKWLEEKFSDLSGLKVTLPSEAEWEKAARGPDGRRYPWGDDPDSNRANYDNTGIDDSSAVGCFPGGASPYGVEEMSGNVWEWTRSLWGNNWAKPKFGYPYVCDDGRENLEAGRDILRVVRGGSFGFQRLARCASRNWYAPYLHWPDLGFRVALVASPFTLDSDL